MAISVWRGPRDLTWKNLSLWGITQHSTHKHGIHICREYMFLILIVQTRSFASLTEHINLYICNSMAIHWSCHSKTVLGHQGAWKVTLLDCHSGLPLHLLYLLSSWTRSQDRTHNPLTKTQGMLWLSWQHNIFSWYILCLCRSFLFKTNTSNSLQDHYVYIWRRV